jgi:2-dehydro-3-deoxyglucarate aldolase/4-hydroxy-2-oxoheptanedioate aldolase
VKDNAVKRALASGGVALGSMVFEFSSTGIARAAAAAGAEFLIFDMEHTGWSTDTIRMLVSTARGADLVPIVRVPATQYHLIARPLDVGAMGIMVPNVETEEQARLIVRSARYTPEGARGAGFTLAHDDYRPGDVFAKMRRANENVLLIAQIESVTGLENLDRIAAVPGLDVLWIGHFDLTNSMGIPAQFTHPDYLAAVDRVIAACTRNGKAAGFMVADVEGARAALRQGFRALAYWGDVWLYQSALRQGLDAVRAIVAESGPRPEARGS